MALSQNDINAIQQIITSQKQNGGCTDEILAIVQVQARQAEQMKNMTDIMNGLTIKFDELHNICVVDNGTKSIRTLARDALSKITDHLKEKETAETKKKESISKFQWIMITALSGNIIGTIFAVFK